MAMTLKTRWRKLKEKINLKKIIGGALLVLLLALAGFLLGIYLRIFDTNELNEKYGLYDIPVIGQYFVTPPTGEPEEPPEPEKPKVEKSKPITLSPKELEKQRKERQAAERKRLSKIARLYNELKPQTAADILVNLDDDVVIAILQRVDESQAAKIISKLDPARAASITKAMYVGKATNMSSAGDKPLEQRLKEAEDAANEAKGQ